MSEQATTPRAASTTSATATTTGVRLGRRGTLLTLYTHGLRSCFGLGRRATSKIFPWASRSSRSSRRSSSSASARSSAASTRTSSSSSTRTTSATSGSSSSSSAPPSRRARRARPAQPDALALLLARRLAARLRAREARRADERDARAHARAAAAPLRRQRHGRRRPRGLHPRQLGSRLPDHRGLARSSRSVIASVGLCIAAYLPRRAYATAAIVGTFILTLCGRQHPHGDDRPDGRRGSSCSSARSPGRARSSGSSASTRSPANVARRCEPRRLGVPPRRPSRRSPRPSALTPATLQARGRTVDRHASSLKDVSRWYGNVVAVNGISFTASPGITGLLGPNGAGKSTLLHMLAGFLKPSAGEVTVLGEPAWENPALYRQLGLVPERESVYGSLTGSSSCASTRDSTASPTRSGRLARRSGCVDLEDAADRHDRRLLQGDEAAHQGRSGARPRPGGAAARRAVQRRRPAPASPHDGAVPQARRRRPHDHLLVAHPRRGRAARRAACS